MKREIPFGRPMIGEEEKRAVLEVLDGPVLVHGPRAKRFEEDFAAFTGAPRAVSVSSCTAAMHLCYFHLGLGPGDEVVVPAQTHVATAHAVEFCGARPVFVDAEPATGNIDLDRIEEAITDRTRAIAVVHFLGLPVRMDRVADIARKRGLFLLEDCALAIGSKFKGRCAGLWGDAGCFSFYPVKHMTTAEGGMLICNDGALADAVTRKKAFGVDRFVGERKIPGVYDVTTLGFNYRLNEIQAAMGSEQVKKLDGFLKARKRNHRALEAALREIDEIQLFESSRGDFESSYYCLSVLLKKEWEGRRFEIVERLKENGVGTSVYYPKPVPHMRHYREKYGVKEDAFPVAKCISDASIALPVGPHLDEEDMAAVARELKDAIASSGR